MLVGASETSVNEIEVEMTSGISSSAFMRRKSSSFLDFDNGVELRAGYKPM